MTHERVWRMCGMDADKNAYDLGRERGSYKDVEFLARTIAGNAGLVSSFLVIVD